MKKLYRDYDWFYRHWVELGTPSAEMAEICGCTCSVIPTWRARHGLKQRHASPSTEGRLRMSRAHIGSSHTPETKKKIREGILGHKHTPEALKRMSIAQRGHPVSERTREKMSIAGKLRFASFEARKEQSDRVRGFKHTEEAKKKISTASKESSKRPDVRKKRRESLLRYWTDDHRKERSELMRKVAARPGVQRKKSESLRRAWAEGKFDGRNCRPDKPSSIERETIQDLTELNFNFILEWSPKSYRRVFDFYLPDLGVTIECQGNYYHDDATFHGISIRDAEKQQWAIDHSYTPIELWEDDIKEYGAKLLLVEELVGEGIL